MTMMLSPFVQLAVVALSLGSAAASLDNSLLTTAETRSPGIIRSIQTLHTDSWTALRRTLSRSVVNLGRSSDQMFRQSQSMDMTWNDATLFQFGNISVSCRTCYVKGKAIVSLTVEENFNVTSIIGNFTKEVWTEIENVTDTVIDFIGDFADNVTSKALENGFDFDAYELPTLDVDFNVPIPDLPEAVLELEFDGLELYMLLDAVIEAAPYTLAIYPSKQFPAQPLGFKFGDELIGVVVTLDLILALDVEAAISTGIHLNLDKVSLKIPMFDNDVSSITLGDGKFEFLPVIVNTSGVVLEATLQLGVTAGLTANANLLDIPGIDMSAGAQVGMWANLAQLTTNVTVPTSNSVDLGSISTRDDDTTDDDCLMPVVEVFAMAIGAQAGASIAAFNNTWGPSPSTQIPVFYTTLEGACADIKTDSTVNTAAVTARADPGLVERADLTTTTISEVFTFSAVGCQSSGFINCPASMQTTSKFTTTSTLVTSVTSGQKATFPASQSDAVTTAVDFGSSMNRLTATTGIPKSFIPPPPSPTSSGGSGDGGISGILGSVEDDLNSLSDADKKLIIGLSVGIGVPLVVGIIMGCWYCKKRRGYTHLFTKAERIQGVNAAEPFLAGGDIKWKDQTRVSVMGTGLTYN